MIAEYTAIIDRLTKVLAKLKFSEPITHVYNPLSYARAPHLQYFERYARRGVPAVWLGMNPGPWGMAQTGVPFGEVSLVRDWLDIDAPVKKPKGEHPKRPIEGFACTKSEVSGARLWGLARASFTTPQKFFQHFFVVNYCPLVFMEASGKNFTPDKLRASEAEPLYAACDKALREIIELLAPKMIVGVGAFAEERAREVMGEGFSYGRVLHPSPASPLANKDWPGEATKALKKLGVWPA